MITLTDIKYDIEQLTADIKEYCESQKKLDYKGGEICPKCNSYRNSFASDSRVGADGIRIRTRECKNCGHRWKTAEINYKEVKRRR